MNQDKLPQLFYVAHPVGPELSKKDTQSVYSFRGYLPKNWKLVIALSVILMGWVAAYSLLVHKDTYTARAKVLVKDSAITNRYVQNTVDAEAPRTTSASNSSPILNMMDLVYSSATAQKLYNHLKQHYPATLRELKITNLNEWNTFYKDGAPFLKTKNKAGTDVITLWYTWSDAKMAQSSLEALLTAFKAVNLDLNQQEQHERFQYLETQMVDIEAQLAEVRDNKSNLKTELSSLNFQEQQSAMEHSRLALRQELDVVRAKTKAKLAEYQRYNKMIGLTSSKAISASSLGLNKRLTDLKQRLFSLSQQYAHDSQIYAQENPKLIAMKSEMEQVRQDIEDESRQSALNSNTSQATGIISDESTAAVVGKMASAEAEAESYRAQEGSLSQALGELNTRMRQAPINELRVKTVEDKEAALAAALESLRRRATEAKLQETQTLSNIFIVDHATFPLKADFPRRQHLLVIGALLSVLSAYGLVLFYERIQEARKPLPPPNPEHSELLTSELNRQLAESHNGASMSLSN